MAYVRFPIPEFNPKEFKGMQWTPPSFLGADEIKRLSERQKAGDAAAHGAYAVKPADAFFDKLNVLGDNRHAVMCVMPDGPVKVLGRSHAWFVQRAIAVDSLDPAAMNTVIDWMTPRPMNTRLGPDDGATVDGGILYVVCCRAYGDHWIGNRTILDNGWRKGKGFRVLSASVDKVDDFHEIYLAFEW